MIEMNEQINKIIKKSTKGKKNIKLTIGYLEGENFTIKVYGENGELFPADKYNYEIGSITKTFTTSLLAKYVEENKVSLDDSISKYIHGLNKDEYYPSLVRLATHTSGYSPTLPLGNLRYGKIFLDLLLGKGDMKSNNPLDMDFDIMVSLIEKNKLKDKDYSWKYSNFGMSLVGYVLGAIPNKSYFEVMESFIKNDLGLSSTYLGITKETLQGYDNKNINCGNWQWHKDNIIAAAGGITSNAEDLLEYAKINMYEDKTYLKLCHQKHRELKKSDMGLGWMLSKKNNNIIYHEGGTGCFASFLGYDKEKKVAAVVLSNCRLAMGSEQKIGLGLLES